MRGNAIGKPEMLLEPLLVVLSPDANCLRPICPGDHCHDRNNQEVTEYMQAINMRPRILQIFKTGKNRINVIELDLGHKRRLSKGNWGRISAPIYHCQKTARAQLALDSLSNPECALAVALNLNTLSRSWSDSSCFSGTAMQDVLARRTKNARLVRDLRQCISRLFLELLKRLAVRRSNSVSGERFLRSELREAS